MSDPFVLSRMNDSRSGNGPPSFDDPFVGESTEKRVYGTVLQTREPATARAVADRADCDPKTAQKYLDWFAQLGIVTRHDGRPTTYERNEPYFAWRRANDLATAHTLDDLRERIVSLTERIEAYREKYGVDTPAAVDALAIDTAPVETVYEDLADWETARHERRLHERARQLQSDRTDSIEA